MGDSGSITCWLMKAEPDTRIEKGHDVSFPVSKFEEVEVTSWEGVRSHEAKKILGEKMKLDHKVLFYASNTKVPGVAALAKVVKEGYPDYNAWDPAHPYYDPKSDPKNPTWMMVDILFLSKLSHFVPLKLLQALSQLSPSDSSLPPYLTKEHLEGIKKMALLNRGRLSVQPVEDVVYDAIVLLGEKGGWEALTEKPKAKAKNTKKEDEIEKPKKAAVKRKQVETKEVEESLDSGGSKRPRRGAAAIK